MPGHNIKRRVAKLGDMKAAAPFDHQLMRGLAVLESRHRGLEITRVGKAVGTDRTAVWKGEFGPVILAQIAACRVTKRVVFRHHAARDDGNMAGANLHPSHFGENLDLALLRNDQHLSIGVDQHPVAHRAGNRVDAGRHADMLTRITSACHRANAVDEIDIAAGQWQGVPAILAKWQIVGITIGRCLPPRHIGSGESAGVTHRWPDPVQP